MSQRAYIKLDPGFPERKNYYPDGPWRALVTLFCEAVHQPTPGVFKNERLIKVLLDRHARHLQFLLDERDLIKQRDGSYLVVGWKEWQEGTYASVGARMDAIEKRRRPMTPAERAFVYRQKKKDRERDASLAASRDASRVTESDVTSTLRNGTERRAARHAEAADEDLPSERLARLGAPA